MNKKSKKTSVMYDMHNFNLSRCIPLVKYPIAPMLVLAFEDGTVAVPSAEALAILK